MSDTVSSPDQQPAAVSVSALHAAGDERARRATLSSVAAIVARIVAAATSIVTVPVLLDYLGLERYGIWVTVTAATAWLGLGHIGLGPSLLNRLASLKRDDRSGRAVLVASAWWLSIVLGSAVIVAFVIGDYFGVWAAAANATISPLQGDARAVALAMAIGIAGAMPLGLGPIVLRANQTGYLASAMEATASVGRLLAIVLAVALDLGIAVVALASILIPLLVIGSATVVIMGSSVAWPRRSLVSGRLVRALLTTGVGFTGLTIAGLLISSTDVIIIAQVLGPASVPPYAITFALLMLFVSLEMAVLDSVWPAYSDAAARGDRDWIRETNQRITVGLVLASVLFSLGMLVIGQAFIAWWAGPEAVPPTGLLVALSAISIVQAVLMPHGRVLTALGHVRRNTLVSLAGAAINLPLSIALVGPLGIAGVALGTLAAYIVTGGFLVTSARSAIDRVGRHAAGERA